MPPKKRIKIGGQRTISSLFATSASVEDANTAIDASKEGDSVTEKTEKSTDTTDNKSKSEVRSFQQKWLKLWSWLKYEEEKMFCTECLKNGRINSFTTGCRTFKTSSMVRHEATTDHQSNKETTLLQAGMKTAVENKNIEEDRGFGSDGASVMSGIHKGVQAVLKDRNPHMVHLHCMAHRLGLCTSQAANGIPAIKQYQEWITSLHYYFKKSACREAELNKVQEVLQSPTLRYKEIHEVRWLSFYEALEAVYRTLDALITYFNSRDAPNDPKAKGLLKKLATTQFFYITYMLMDTMSIVTRLCLAFQAEDLDVAKAKIHLDLCLADLNAYLTGRQTFKTHIALFETDVKKVGDHYEYNGLSCNPAT